MSIRSASLKAIEIPSSFGAITDYPDAGRDWGQEEKGMTEDVNVLDSCSLKAPGSWTDEGSPSVSTRNLQILKYAA